MEKGWDGKRMGLTAVDKRREIEERVLRVGEFGSRR